MIHTVIEFACSFIIDAVVFGHHELSRLFGNSLINKVNNSPAYSIQWRTCHIIVLAVYFYCRKSCPFCQSLGDKSCKLFVFTLIEGITKALERGGYNISFGVSVWNKEESNMEIPELVKEAEQNMFSAKKEFYSRSESGAHNRSTPRR